MTTAIRQQQEEIKHILLKWYFAKPTQDYYIFPQKQTSLWQFQGLALVFCLLTIPLT